MAEAVDRLIVSDPISPEREIAIGPLDRAARAELTHDTSDSNAPATKTGASACSRW